MFRFLPLKVNIALYEFIQKSAATEPTLAGMSDNDTKSLGHCQTDAFRAYINISVFKLVSNELVNNLFVFIYGPFHVLKMLYFTT